MKSIDQIQEELIKEFAGASENLESTILIIIQKGKQLPMMAEIEKTDKYLIKGCHTKVWLKAYFFNNSILFKADSNTKITKGLISLLISIYNRQPSESIINANLEFLKRINLERYIGKQRSLGLETMIDQIKFYANEIKASNIEINVKNKLLQLS
jgi:cysteine desulfuration protein SufE